MRVVNQSQAVPAANAPSHGGATSSFAPRPARYSAPQRWLHWSMAVLIATLWVMGYVMTRHIQPDTDLQVGVYYLHISLGVVVLGLLGARLAIRIKDGAPPLPEAIPRHERRLAELGHVAVYGLIFLVGFSGWLMTETYGYPMIVFGVELPPIFAKRETIWGVPVQPLLSQIHAILAYLLAVLIAGHVLAVFKHSKAHKVNLMQRMT